MGLLPSLLRMERKSIACLLSWLEILAPAHSGTADLPSVTGKWGCLYAATLIHQRWPWVLWGQTGARPGFFLHAFVFSMGPLLKKRALPAPGVPSSPQPDSGILTHSVPHQVHAIKQSWEKACVYLDLKCAEYREFKTKSISSVNARHVFCRTFWVSRF